MRFFFFLHVLADIVWIGGMFLAYMAVRPTAAEVLEPPLRLKLWEGIFRRFFPYVWASVAVLLITGFAMMDGMGRVPAYVTAMAVIGIVMAMIFFYIYFLPFAQLKAGVAAAQWKDGGAALARIRTLVGVNLILGLVNVAVATLGPML